jgi:hypothetical protein
MLSPLGPAVLPQQSFLAYNWYTGHASLLSFNNKNPTAMPPLEPGYEGHGYFVVVPTPLDKWTLLGEVDKFVPLSSKRFTRVVADGSGLSVTLEGAGGEDVRVCALSNPGLEKVCKTVSFGSSGGSQTVVFSR